MLHKGGTEDLLNCVTNKKEDEGFSTTLQLREPYTAAAFGSAQEAFQALADDWNQYVVGLWAHLDAGTHESLLWEVLSRCGKDLDDEIKSKVDAEVKRTRRAERLLAKHQADRAILIEALDAQEAGSSKELKLSRQHALESEIRELKARNVVLLEQRDDARRSRLERLSEKREDGASSSNASGRREKDRDVARRARDEGIIADLRGRVISLEAEVRSLRARGGAPHFDEGRVVVELTQELKQRTKEVASLKKEIVALKAAAVATARSRERLLREGKRAVEPEAMASLSPAQVALMLTGLLAAALLASFLRALHQVNSSQELLSGKHGAGVKQGA